MPAPDFALARVTLSHRSEADKRPLLARHGRTILESATSILLLGMAVLTAIEAFPPGRLLRLYSILA
jgi:hypothetical protein